MDRAQFIVLTGGCLVTFRVKRKEPFRARKHRYPLYGSYVSLRRCTRSRTYAQVYSGLLAQDELHEAIDEDALAHHARIYQDGLRTSDGSEDTTFCVRLSRTWRDSQPHPWEADRATTQRVPRLSKKAPKLLIFRARSKLERDRWVWAINAEMERQVRSHVEAEEALRMYGDVPEQ